MAKPRRATLAKGILPGKRGLDAPAKYLSYAFIVCLATCMLLAALPAAELEKAES
jgi:hypothetical protein